MEKEQSPRSGRQAYHSETLSPTPWVALYLDRLPGVPLRSAPGYMLPPAPQAEKPSLLAELTLHSNSVIFCAPSRCPRAVS
jgi:hypothetical protein